MKNHISALLIGFCLALPAGGFASEKKSSLSSRQQNLVCISALTASGDIDRLKPALHAGLDNDLTISEIKEIMVHLYAYTGFPRSLNGLNALMDVVKERKASGIKDAEGKEASPVPADLNKDQYGAKVRAKLAGLESDISGAEWQLFSPIMDTFLKEHLFADIFVRDVLDHQERELVTIAALANMTGTEGQLFFHLGAAMNTGLSQEQIQEFISVFASKVDKGQADIAQKVLAAVLNSRK